MKKQSVYQFKLKKVKQYQMGNEVDVSKNHTVMHRRPDILLAMYKLWHTINGQGVDWLNISGSVQTGKNMKKYCLRQY